MTDHLHIVCLDAPSPPDYGGAIDMYYKIKALAETGRKIILHYFDYNPTRDTKGLETICYAVHAYKRKSFFRSPPLSRPFIVQSRINKDLIKRLNEDDAPILLEGLHCAGLIPHLKHQQRVVLRMHNNEAAYYHHLAQN
ncbi:MAG TPA: mannosyltransferase, partial [Flavisolibacter sp.]